MTRRGVWTQNAEILCDECAKHVGHGVKMMMDGSAVAYCEHCHAPILCDEDIQQEQELQYLIRQVGFCDSYMAQTGGMCHALEVEVSTTHQVYLFSITSHRDDDWYIEIYEQNDFAAGRTASSMQEIIEYVQWVRRGNTPVV